MVIFCHLTLRQSIWLSSGQSTPVCVRFNWRLLRQKRYPAETNPCWLKKTLKLGSHPDVSNNAGRSTPLFPLSRPVYTPSWVSFATYLLFPAPSCPFLPWSGLVLCVTARSIHPPIRLMRQPIAIPCISWNVRPLLCLPVRAIRPKGGVGTWTSGTWTMWWIGFKPLATCSTTKVFGSTRWVNEN